VPHNLVTRSTAKTLSLTPLTEDGLGGWLNRRAKALRDWVREADFTGTPGETLLLPAAGGGVGGVLLGVEGQDDIWSWSAAVERLPAGRYAAPKSLGAGAATRAALGWALGTYVFDRYREKVRPSAELVWPARADRAAVLRRPGGVGLVRDLVNTPSADMGPAELAAAARKLAREFKARCGITVGGDLLKKGYPMIHAVGRASDRAPRLIDLTWGRPRDPKVTLVGKGVCFDSGGLDLKGAQGMKQMKKDMGGAAQVLGLARMIMMAGLPVRLRVLIPAVENSVSGNAFRPLDVLKSRKGLTVEIGNTDAEGRLVLADALAEAVSEAPDLVLDFATLTGAARVALGPGLPAMFCNDDALAGELETAGRRDADPVWRMPLFEPYRRTLESKVADLNNIGDMPQGGAITAALFLEAFVASDIPWAHFDVYAWNAASRPGRPEGGEAMAIHAAFEVIENRFGKS